MFFFWEIVLVFKDVYNISFSEYIFFVNVIYRVFLFYYEIKNIDINC